jgi:hypothetical protein
MSYVGANADLLDDLRVAMAHATAAGRHPNRPAPRLRVGWAYARRHPARSHTLEGACRAMAAAIDRRVLFDVFESGLDDWVSLSEVGGFLSRRLAVPDDDLCTQLRRCVNALVGQGWFRAGTVQADGGFTGLSRPVDEVLGEICQRWAGWDEPTWWYAVWLELTDDGRAEAVRLFPELEEFA